MRDCLASNNPINSKPLIKEMSNNIDKIKQFRKTSRMIIIKTSSSNSTTFPLVRSPPSISHQIQTLHLSNSSLNNCLSRPFNRLTAPKWPRTNFKPRLKTSRAAFSSHHNQFSNQANSNSSTFSSSSCFSRCSILSSTPRCSKLSKICSKTRRKTAITRHNIGKSYSSSANSCNWSNYKCNRWWY